MNELAAALARPGVWLADGGMGTWLVAKGVDTRELSTLPLTNADVVLNSHLEYLRSGARILETHTFSANGSKLGAMGIEAPVAELNRRAAQLARHARDIFGEPAYILGSLGPLAAPVDSEIMPGLGLSGAIEVYREAVSGLLAGGVDGFIVETMSDLPTVRAAVAAIREQSDLPVLVLFAFSPLGMTLYGVTPEEAVQAMAALPGGPPALIGANCGSGPSPLLDAVIRMAPLAKAAGMGLAAYPNAGQPTRKEGHIHYPASPEYVAAIAPALKAAGCQIVGGCCGTTPAHIEAVRHSLAEPVRDSVPSGPLGIGGDESALRTIEPLAEGPGQRLPDLLAKRFVISVELDPPRGANPHRLLQAARVLAQAGADAINIADSPMARVRLSALATARLVAEAVPLQTILHFTTRDRNLMGLQSDLLGAHALGLRNVLCLTGDPPGLGDYAHATAVYDLDSIGLTRVLAGFNRGEDALGQKLGAPTHFAIGVGVNPNAEPLEQEVERFRRKLEAGAHFAMSQPIYAPEQLLRFLDVLGGLPIPLLLGAMPLVSYRQALYLHNEVPGISIPAPILSRMAETTDGTALGIEMMLSLIQELAPLVQGVYLIPSFNRVEPLLPLIQGIRRLTGSATDDGENREVLS